METPYNRIEASPQPAQPGPPAVVDDDADTNLLRVTPQPRHA